MKTLSTQTRTELIDEIYKALKEKAIEMPIGVGRNDATTLMIRMGAVKKVLRKYADI